jgi:hypothetical protein
MSTWESVDHYFSGQGVVLLAKRDATGNPTGFFPVGNVKDLKITVNTSTIEHKESHSGQRGIDLRLTTETKCALSMTMENFLADNLSLASRGISTKQVGASVVDHGITCYLGKVVSLPHIKISSVVISDGLTPLTEGTDYLLNTDAGSIKFSNTITGVVDGDALSVDYTYATQFKVDTLVTGNTDMFMRFEGLNTAEGNDPVVIEVFKFSIDPFKELALIGDTVQTFVLSGSVLTDTLRSTGSKYFAVQKLN